MINELNQILGLLGVAVTIGLGTMFVKMSIDGLKKANEALLQKVSEGFVAQQNLCDKSLEQTRSLGRENFEIKALIAALKEVVIELKQTQAQQAEIMHSNAQVLANVSKMAADISTMNRELLGTLRNGLKLA